MNATLNISQVSNRGNKFAITSGKSILAKYATVEAAKKALETKREFFNYWANSASVSLDNAKWLTIQC